MKKHILAIILAFSSANFLCKGTCPLDTADGEIVTSQNIKQMNGTWNEYKKTTDFLTNETCVSYNIGCSNETSCVVNLVQKEKTISTIALTNNETIVKWGDRKPFYLNVDTETGFALLWDCEGENNKTYELAVLMVNVSNGAKEVDELVKKINITYKTELNGIKETCDATTSLTINLSIICLALYIVMNT